MDILEFYSAQSPFTDPGKNVQMYEGIPASVAEICKILGYVTLDYSERWKYPIQNERWLETNNRYADEFLDSIKAQNKKAKVCEERPADQRMMTSVSHVATLCVSMLRYVGIPARKRVGFVNENGTYTTYEVVEYYDAESKTVKVADPNGKGLEFIPAAKAFADCRSGKISADKFVNADTKGTEVVVFNLILDLAAVNKHEMLSWDRYGWMLRPISDFSDRAWEILAQVADVLTGKASDIEALTAAYEMEEGLMVPQIIYCDTPIVPPHKAVIR